MKIGLNLDTGKKEEPKADIEEPLEMVGVHIWTDRHFDKRLEKNLGVVDKGWDKETLDELKKGGMSPVKVNVLKRVNSYRAYLEENIPHGRAVENPRLSAAVRAINDLILMAENTAFSDASDDATAIITNDYFARCHDITWHTFDSKNTVVNKAFTIQGMVNPNRDKAPPERDDGLSLQAAAERHRNKEATSGG